MSTDVFRFSDSYEDVFVEDGHYLYACNEPFDRAYMLACNEYHTDDTQGNPIEWCFVRYDTSGADVEYLRSLQHAPADVARAVIVIETRRMLAFEDMPDDEKESYLDFTRERLAYEATQL